MKDRKEYFKEYYQKHKTELDKKHAEWRENNPENARKIHNRAMNKYYKKRRKGE